MQVAIVIIHDLFGWKSPNARLLADHYAKEVDATVYIPDLYVSNEPFQTSTKNGNLAYVEIILSFHGEIVNQEDYKKGKIDMEEFLPRFLARHPKELRFPEIESYVKSLKQEHGFTKIGAIGFCWGGWAVFQLGGKGKVGLIQRPRSATRNQTNIKLSGKNLVDCISTAHPSLLTKEEINAVSVPVQIIAPEHDPELTPEKKAHANAVIPSLKVEYDYQYFPGMSHGFAARCYAGDVQTRRALERAKNAVVGWFAHFLHVRE